MSRFALSEEAVRIDAQAIGIDPSTIAGRIRKERGNYSILTGLVGQGQVRSQLEDTDMGSDYSSGDDYIAKCANQEEGASNQTRWKAVGINHHITHVLDDLSTLAAAP